MPGTSRTTAEAVLGEMRWLRGLALRLVRDEHAADDVVQDTWVTAAEKGPDGLRGRGLRAWLATVALNVVRRRQRDDALRRRHETERLLELADGEPPDEVERLRRQRMVADLVLELREPYRSAVLLRFQEGLAYGRIAQRHDITKDAARKRVSRGLALLRERLDHTHDGDRRAWSVALLGLVDRGELAAVGSMISIGGITMGVKTMTAAAVSLVAAVGLYAWLGDAAPAPKPPLEVRAQTPITDLVPADAPRADGSAELVSVPALRNAAEPTSLGAVATADVKRDLHGRVLGPDDGPVPGAAVTVRHDDIRQVRGLDIEQDKLGAVIAEAVTDAFGEFAIALPPGRPCTLLVEKDGFAPSAHPDRFAGEFVEVRLGRPAVLTGRVFRESDGEGVPAAMNAWKRDGGTYYVIEGRTRPDGTFRFDDLAADSITLEVHPEGAADPDWRTVDLVAGETLSLEIPCPAGHTIRGSVTDAATGAPIAGAEVGQGWTFDKPILTDARGEYVFEHFKIEGIYEIAARAQGYGRQKKDIASAADGLVVDFALPPARSVVGRVVDPAGEPLRGVYVAAVASSRGKNQQTDWQSARTLADGTFEIRNVRADSRHALKLFRAGYAEAVYDFPEDEQARAFVDLGTIALRAPSRVEGVVIDEDGSPLTDCHVELEGTNADRDLLGGSPTEIGLHYIGSREGRTDHLGRFSFADLSAGSYELSVRQADGPSQKQAVAVPPETVVDDVEIELVTGLELAGRVVDPAGEPVFSVVMVKASPMTANGMHQAMTGRNGTFRVAGLSEGAYEVEAFPIETDGRALLGVTLEGIEAGRTDLELRLGQGDVIRGKVLDAQGNPVLNATVRAFDPDDPPDAERMIAAMDTTQPDGSFELSLDAGAVVDLVATPPPTDAPFYRFDEVDPALGTTLYGVEAGTQDLVLSLP